MAPKDHLDPEDYVATLRGELPVGWLHERSHQHLLQACSTCRDRWQSGRPEEKGAAEAAFVLVPSLPADPREVSLQDVEACRNLAAACRESARRARDDLSRLLQLPPQKWRRRVKRSQTRFRSADFALLLIEESRAKVRTSAGEAAVLAALVVPALDRTEGRLDQPWARVLVARAAAHHANALRVAGDLPAAGAAFADLRHEITLRPLGDPIVLAETYSLEASLWIDRRETRRAQQCLSTAMRTYEAAGDSVGVTRTLIELANILQAAGQATEVAPILERAAARIDREAEPHLYRCILHGRLTALLDLDRVREAAVLVDQEKADYFADEDRHSEAAFAFLQARIDLGLEHYEDAEAGFVAVRDQLLAIDRTYDAILASLYLADALLAAGKMPAACELAAELVPMFRARGVTRETLAALRLLSEAGRAEALTVTLVDQVRRRIVHRASAAGTTPAQP